LSLMSIHLCMQRLEDRSLYVVLYNTLCQDEFYELLILYRGLTLLELQIKWKLWEKVKFNLTLQNMPNK